MFSSLFIILILITSYLGSLGELFNYGNSWLYFKLNLVEFEFKHLNQLQFLTGYETVSV